MRFLLITAAALMAVATAPADAQRRDREQDAALKATQSGRFVSLRSIESRVVPRMRVKGADYLGPELDARAGRYRLKFMRGARVIWIDVDARSGQVIGRSGN